MNSKQRFPLLLVVVFGLSVISACQLGSEPPLAPTETLQKSSPTTFPTFPSRTPRDTPTPTATLRPSSTPLPTFTQAPSLTPIPTDTPTPAVFGVDIPFGPLRDDFSDPLSGWTEESGSEYGFGYASGAFNFYINKVNTEIGAARTRNHSDIVVQVDITKNDGPPTAYFGVTCRENLDSHYSLAINGNGEYYLSRTDASTPILLASGASPIIKKGNATNRLEGRCIDNTFTIIVNGREVLSFIDERYGLGNFVGLVVGTTIEEGIDVSFDNFNARPGE